MAKNREPQKPAQSESDEEEESGDEASSEEVNSQESESEPESEPQVSKKVSTPATQQKQIKAAPVKTQSSSEEEEEESGSESESDSDRPDVTPTQQKSISGPKKPRSDVQATTSTAAKRPAEEKESEGRDAKKVKKEPDSPVKNSKDDSKKSLFQRLWSEDDEIAILNGMIEYSNIKKKDPVADLSAFLDFIKENLHVDVSRTQLQDKIRRLKKKYENNKSKEKDGKGRTFAKSHEHKAYELSKLIWGLDVFLKDHGGENGWGGPRANGISTGKASGKKAASASVNANAKAKATDEDEEAKDSKSGVLVSFKSQNGGFNSIGMSVEEIELYVKQVELKLAQSRLVLSSLKSQDC
ncbi:hypothetical protein ACS0TY_001986 [Phlomoides rotata]